MNKPNRTDLAPIYVKELFELENIFDIYERYAAAVFYLCIL